MEFQVEDDPDPLDIGFLETQIRREASAAMGLGDEAELAIFVREAGTIVAGISGWTWGDCCELQSLWVDPSFARSLARVRGSSPLPRPRRRRAGARRPSTSPTASRLGASTSGPATNLWVGSRTSHPERTSSGTANV